MKKIFALSFLILLLNNTKLMAQRHKDNTSYSTAVGVKFYPGGITFKQKIVNDNYFEAIAYTWKGTRITGLYEMHYEIGGLDGLQWYVGPGAHIAFYSAKNYSGASYIGVDGVLGLDLKIKNAPLNISLDWQPSFDFRSYDAFNSGFGGLGVRYTIR